MPPYKSVPAREDQLFMPDRASWRAWLVQNHATRSSIWLVFTKKTSSTRSIDYAAAVEEALCFGWIDSKVQRIDEERYRQYFSARKPDGYWNGANKKRVAKLVKAGLMTPAGRAAIDAAKANGSWEFLDDVEGMVLPDDLAAALAQQPGARDAYEGFSNTKKQGVLLWIKQAKREATRANRIARVVAAASRGETPFDYL